MLFSRTLSSEHRSSVKYNWFCVNIIFWMAKWPVYFSVSYQCISHVGHSSCFIKESVLSGQVASELCVNKFTQFSTQAFREVDTP